MLLPQKCFQKICLLQGVTVYWQQVCKTIKSLSPLNRPQISMIMITTNSLITCTIMKMILVQVSNIVGILFPFLFSRLLLCVLTPMFLTPLCSLVLSLFTCIYLQSCTQSVALNAPTLWKWSVPTLIPTEQSQRLTFQRVNSRQRNKLSTWWCWMKVVGRACTSLKVPSRVHT